MDTKTVTQTLTKTGVILVFWLVLLFSLILSERMSLEVLVFALLKSFFVSGVTWIILLLFNDTLVKSLMNSAKEAKNTRFNGGLSYHVTEMSPEEKAWIKRHKDEYNQIIEDAEAYHKGQKS